jgi:hypothetical protein
MRRAALRSLLSDSFTDVDAQTFSDGAVTYASLAVAILPAGAASCQASEHYPLFFHCKCESTGLSPERNSNPSFAPA